MADMPRERSPRGKIAETETLHQPRQGFKDHVDGNFPESVDGAIRDRAFPVPSCNICGRAKLPSFRDTDRTVGFGVRTAIPLRLNLPREFRLP
jgi:hypothetical protein